MGTGLINIEESRVSRATQILGLQDLYVGDLAANTRSELNVAAKVEAAQAVGVSHWRAAKETLRSEASFDDRPLYWQRLAEKRHYRSSCSTDINCAEILYAYEWASRGAVDLSFESESQVRIVLSGFDPFLLDVDISQSNPSGVAALMLDGQVLETTDVCAEIQTVLIPVRFADFDAGRIEALFGPLIADNKVDVLITLSMGRSDFDLERFPGRRRSSEVSGNLRESSGANLKNPLIPMLGENFLPGPEFVEFSLPAEALLKVHGPYKVHDNRTVSTLEQGEFEAASLSQLSGQTAVRGSGGGYLSNEISYRTVRLVRKNNSAVRVGHIHTPRIQGFDRLTVKRITNQIQELLKAMVAELGVPGSHPVP